MHAWSSNHLTTELHRLLIQATWAMRESHLEHEGAPAEEPGAQAHDHHDADGAGQRASQIQPAPALRHHRCTTKQQTSMSASCAAAGILLQHSARPRNFPRACACGLDRLAYRRDGITERCSKCECLRISGSLRSPSLFQSCKVMGCHRQSLCGGVGVDSMKGMAAAG